VHRRMADPAFRQSQLDAVYAPHVEPINRLVDRLRDEVTRSWVPYVAPDYGGVAAQVLLLLRDPGRMTNSRTGDGSGFLCVQNDDPTAERLAMLLARVGLSPRQCIAWNAYPWYINQAPTAAQIAAGVDPLVSLLKLLTAPRVVILLGSEAAISWRRTEQCEPDLVRPLRVLRTRHASKQAFIGTEEQRSFWMAQQLDVFHEAAAVMRGEKPSTRVESVADISTAFVNWLKQQEWAVVTSPREADIVATKGGETMIAEVKGVTSSPGLDVDTMYGRLLRRMSADTLVTRFAVVVPSSAAAAAARVPRAIRSQLKVDAYTVDLAGTVRPLW